MHYFTLSFEVIFESVGDTCWFVPAYPYTLTTLREFERRVLKSHEARDVVRWTPLCNTLAGNECGLLTITNFNASPTDVLVC